MSRRTSASVSPDIAQLVRMLPQLRLAFHQRAGRDAAFRAELTRSPRAVLEREAGLAVGCLHALPIAIAEEPPGGLTFVIPAACSEGDFHTRGASRL